jgi:hypothetical protein
MTAQAATTTVESVEAPDSIAPRLDPAEACGTLTILVEVTVTTAAVLGAGALVSPAAGEEAGGTVTVLVTGTEMLVAPPDVGIVWKYARAPNTMATRRNAPATPSVTVRLRSMCRCSDRRVKVPSAAGTEASYLTTLDLPLTPEQEGAADLTPGHLPRPPGVILGTGRLYRCRVSPLN